MTKKTPDPFSARLWPALELRFPSLADPVLGELIAAAVDDFHPTAIQERERDRAAPTWLVFFETGGDRDRALEALLAAFGDSGVHVTPIEVDDENWAARSQARLRAVAVGRFIVAPPWDCPSPPPAGTRTIVIEPSMGFGTGHHASTRLCLAVLQTLDLDDTRVIDVGTGSGVLAIAAALSGATDVLAIDIDEDALASARDNATRNVVESRITFERLDFRSARLAPADVIFANLTGALLGATLDRLVDLAAANGRLVLSGFTAEDLIARPEGAVFKSLRVEVVERLDEEGWRCLVLRTKSRVTGHE